MAAEVLCCLKQLVWTKTRKTRKTRKKLKNVLWKAEKKYIEVNNYISAFFY